MSQKKKEKLINTPPSSFSFLLYHTSFNTLTQTEEQNDTLHAPFPVDPQEAYQEQETKVLQMLHCSRESIMRESMSKVQTTTSEVMSVADRLMVSLSQPSSSLKTSSKKRERGEEDGDKPAALLSGPSSSSTSVWKEFAQTEDIDW